MSPVLDVYVPESSRQFTEELQLASNSTGPLVWTVGLYYFYNKASQDQSSFFRQFFPVPFLQGLAESYVGTQIAKSVAGFGQTTYSITDHTRLTAGIRYTWERKEFRGQVLDQFPGAPVIVSFSTAPGEHFVFKKPTWRVSVDQDLGERVTGYVSYNRGVKSGGYNIRNPANLRFQPEKLDAYEVGIKSEMMNRKLRLNAAGFYYDYANIQVPIFSATTIIRNGAAAEIYGVDVDLEALVTDRLTLDAGTNWMHAKFKSFPGYLQTTPDPVTGTPSASFLADEAGKDVPDAPHFTYTIGATYKVPLGNGKLAFNVTDSYNSGFYGEADNVMRQGSYHFINASIGWTASDKSLSARIYINNILNKAVVSQMATLESLNYIVDHTNPPRIVGASVQVGF